MDSLRISNDVLKIMSHPRKIEVMDALFIQLRGLRYRCFNSVHNTQYAAIDVSFAWMSNEMSVWLTTISLLVLPSNYHQNVNHQSVLGIIDCSHCYIDFMPVCAECLNSAPSHSLHVLSIIHRFIKWSRTHKHVCKHAQSYTHYTV